MASTAAQDEFNELFRDKERDSRHPEDRLHEADDDTNPSNNNSDDDNHNKKGKSTALDSDNEDENIDTSNMPARYWIPSLRSNANTGPKGVIADALAYEQAKRARRSSYAKNGGVQPVGSPLPDDVHWTDIKSSDDESNDSDGFLARWRQNRLAELQAIGEKAGSLSRSVSPSQKTYGKLYTVDGSGYLDAIEKAPADTIVIVYIYDDASDISNSVERCVRKLARQHITTRFVRLHFAEAEMEEAGIPALLAYRGGEKFAGLVPVQDEIDDDAELSPASLEVAMKKYQMLF